MEAEEEQHLLLLNSCNWRNYAQIIENFQKTGKERTIEWTTVQQSSVVLVSPDLVGPRNRFAIEKQSNCVLPPQTQI